MLLAVINFGLYHLTEVISQQAKQADSRIGDELEKVKKQNRALQEENELLKSKTFDLQLRVDELLEELSRKEAEWCSKEEKLMLEVHCTKGSS